MTVATGTFCMPSLGADMDEGKLVEWRVQPGDRVSRGDLIAVVETSKAAVEVEVWEDGVVEELLVEPGTVVPVGTPLARLAGGDGTRPPAPAAAEPPAPAPAAAPPTAAPPTLAPPATRAGGPLAPAAAGPAAPGAAVPPPPPPQVPPPAAPVARPAAEPAAAPPAKVAAQRPAPSPPRGDGERVPASPYARRRARELGVDLTSLTGTGPHGAIRAEDVEAAAQAAAPASSPQEQAAARREAMREGMARAMARSKREIPHYYLSTQVDLSRATAWLQGVNAERPLAARILPAALLLKAIAAAAGEVPEVNGFYRDDRFEPSDAVHLGVGVSLRGGGLIAPALLDVATKPLPQVMQELRDLVERARGGTLRGREMSDATLTVTNLGDQGVSEVFGVIYPPQVALVGVGKIEDRPWVVEGRVEPRPVVSVSLAADHRASDGHRGARFLSLIANTLQRPEAL